jgi:hypothetical protein
MMCCGTGVVSGYADGYAVRSFATGMAAAEAI